MNPKMLSTACSLLVTAIFMIATTSIATECYNKFPDYKKEKENNFTFLIVTLVFAILAILSAFGSVYMSITSS